LTRFTRHTEGVSGLIKSCSGKKKGKRDTGLLSGSLEAWKMLDLVMQMMFSIGESGHIIPNDIDWFPRMTGLSSNHICANPTVVILSACASAIEMAKLMRSHFYSESDTTLIQYLEKIGRFHHARLAYLRQILFTTINRGDVSTLCIHSAISGNKHHYYTHLRMAREVYGADIRIFDTEASEKLHQLSVVRSHKVGSRRNAGKQRNMLRVFKRAKTIEKFEMYTNLRSGEDDDISAGEDKEEERVFNALSSFRSNKLIIINGDWGLNPEDSDFFFHPIISLDNLHNSIKTIKGIFGIEDNTSYEFHLMEQISCTDLQNEKWSIFCSQHHDRNALIPGADEDFIHKWSFVTANVRDADGSSAVRHCLVLAIIYVECTMIDGTYVGIHLLVAPLESVEDGGILPYDYVQVCSTLKGKVYMETITCKTDVIDGAFVVPILCGRGSDYLSNTDIDENDLSKHQWVVIPKSRFSFPRPHLHCVREFEALSNSIFLEKSRLDETLEYLGLIHDDSLPHVSIDESISSSDEEEIDV